MDRRKTTRIPQKLMVNFGKTGFDGLGLVRNCSFRGLFVESNKVFPVGSQITMMIALPKNEGILPINVKAVWGSNVPSEYEMNCPKGTGFDIINAPAKYFEYISKLLH